PLAEAVWVERLLPRGAEEPLPVDALGVDAVLEALGAGGIAVPGAVDLVDRADRAALEQLVRLDDVRHAPLLRADLHDPLVLILGIDDGLALAQVVGQRLLDVDILAGFT